MPRYSATIGAADLGALALAAAREHFDGVTGALARRADLLASGALPGGWSGALDDDVCPIAAAQRPCLCAGTLAALPVAGGSRERLGLRRALVRAAELRVGARIAVGGALLGGSPSSVHPAVWPVGWIPAPGGMGEESGVVWVEALVAPRSNGSALPRWRLDVRGGSRVARPGSPAARGGLSALWFGDDEGESGVGVLSCAVCGGRLVSGRLSWAADRRGVFGASGRLL